MKGRRGPPRAEVGETGWERVREGPEGSGRASSSPRRQGRGLAADPASAAARPGPLPCARSPSCPGATPPPARPAPRAPSSPIRSSLQVQQSSVNLMHSAGGGARRAGAGGGPGPASSPAAGAAAAGPGGGGGERGPGRGGLGARGAAAASRTPAPAPAPRRGGLGRERRGGPGRGLELRHGGGAGRGRAAELPCAAPPRALGGAPPRPFIHLRPSAKSPLGAARRRLVSRKLPHRKGSVLRCGSLGGCKGPEGASVSLGGQEPRPEEEEAVCTLRTMVVALERGARQVLSLSLSEACSEVRPR